MSKASSKLKTNAREWLRENGYSDVADILDSYLAYNKARGSGERRNYWDLLAGGKNGENLKRHMFTFPILESVRAARKPSYKPSPNAIRRNETEVIPSPVIQPRWENRKDK